jgi:hypothetical protein
LAILICLFCSDNKASFTKIKPDTFIEVPGKYMLGSKQIWLKEFTDGTLIFEIGDDLNRKTLYQQSIFRPFSKNHKWVIYIDKGENIWCYNGDLNDHFVLLYENESGHYTEIDYLRADYLPPHPFTQKIEQK